ncbi:MAG: tetratricopeptide repeat protein, partial [Blastocatellia bacterium]
MNNRISHIVPVLLPILASLLLSPRQLHAQTADAATACQPAAHQHQVCTDPLNDAQDVVLQPGQSLTRALAGGAAHTYQIAAEPGQYLRVVVDQQGVDVLVRLRGPATNMQIDSPIGPFGPERLSAIVPQDAIVPATYRVEVQATGTQPTGCYEITCEPLEQATARDEKQLMGDQAFSAAVGSLEHASDLKTVQGVIGKYEEALANFRDAKDRYGEAAALTGSAFQYGRIGRADTALEYLGLALPIWRALGDQRREAQIYNNSGTLYLQRSEIGFALDCYLRSVPLWCVTGERLGEATALNNIGSVYTEVGDYQTAITYYNRALEMLKGIPDSESQQASTLNNIGLSHVSLQQLDEALTCYSRALEIRRTSPGSDPLRVAQLIANVGFANFFKGDLIAADRAFKESLALRLHKDRAGEASCLYGIGLVYKSRGDLSAALDRFRDALEINRQIHDRVREAITLYAIAGIERDLADISAAYTDVRDAVTIIEELGRSLTNDELRTAYLSSVQDIYRLDIVVLMQMHQKEPKSGYDAAAFKVSEQARARVFLDLLAATRIKVENGVDPALSKQELSLSASLNALANQYTRILSITHTTQQEAALKAQLETTNTQLQQTRARIRQASPRYADLRDPRVIGVEEVQHEVLDDDTVLLEYCLDAQRS